jgi:hypothetical protein
MGIGIASTALKRDGKAQGDFVPTLVGRRKGCDMAERAWDRRGLRSLVCLVFVLFTAWPGAASAGAAVVNHDEFYDFVVPATQGCLGEPVHVSGTVHTVLRVEVNSGGRLHVSIVEAFMDVAAVGVDTGTVYNPTGQPAHFVINLDATSGSDAQVFQLTNRQLFISSGSSDNFVVTEVVVFTTTANGDVAVDSERVSFKCVG